MGRRVFEKLLASDPRGVSATEGYLRCLQREGDAEALIGLWGREGCFI